MDCIRYSNHYCVICIRCSIAEAECVTSWKQFHPGGEIPPGAGIIFRTFTTP